MPTSVKKFPAQKLIVWQKKCGRHNLPWQKTIDPYLRWIAEIMLQQTQVEAVKPYFKAFTQRFPTVLDLAQASEDEVLAYWEGLGYYSRAINAHKCAKAVVEKYAGIFPTTVNELVALPGIGPSTAGAIVSAVTDKPEPIFDGNVKRVFSRFFAIEEVYGSSGFDRKIQNYAEISLPQKEGRTHSQGLMDLGSMICTRSSPKCLLCPVSTDCEAYKSGSVSKYPIKAKQKAKPIREVYWLIGQQDGKIFFQKQEKTGIWKGLWSFPSSQTLPLKVLRRLNVVNHEFTHFKLIATPVIVAPEELSELEGSWFTEKASQEIGMPSPVRKLLRQYFPQPLQLDALSNDT